jgi:hypothetical protein
MLLDIAEMQDVAQIVTTLSSCVRATDYIGWHEVGKRLGIVFAEVETGDREHVARLLTAKIARVLDDRIKPTLSDQITITMLPSERNYLAATTGTT